MRDSRWLVSCALITAASSAACREGAATSEFATDLDAGMGVDADGAAYDFVPQRHARDCTSDEDCVLITAISQCRTCGCSDAVRRGDAQRDEAVVREACHSPGAPKSSHCFLDCGEQRAACFEHVCVSLPLDGGS